MNQIWFDIAEQISERIEDKFSPITIDRITGGCINHCVKLGDGQRSFFVKLNEVHALDMFVAEAKGLECLSLTETVRVPDPVVWGQTQDSAFLVLEYISLESLTRRSARLFGERLAKMHRHTGQAFGWFRDNTIGSTFQCNSWNDSWPQFWAEHRLGFQFRLACENGLSAAISKKGERLLSKIDCFFKNYRPVPSVVHGDLWSGNIAGDDQGNPVIFDPAVYYADREVDIAMTELFGGLNSIFYQSYDETWPLDDGYRARKPLYNLYHILNHYNLFGGQYSTQVSKMIDRLLFDI